ncbi:hypothetical protein JCM8547_008810 [Rhodosporidiobolus lusitaniae]
MDSHANKNSDFPGRSLLTSVISTLGYPNGTEQSENAVGEHDAVRGSGVVDHEAPKTVMEELRGEEGLRTIKTQGNQGQGHDSGLKTKGVAHQEHLAERARLARSGEFEPHQTHEEMVAAHPDTAHELENLPSKEGGGVGRMVDETREKIV